MDVACSSPPGTKLITRCIPNVKKIRLTDQDLGMRMFMHTGGISECAFSYLGRPKHLNNSKYHNILLHYVLEKENMGTKKFRALLHIRLTLTEYRKEINSTNSTIISGLLVLL
jgi:hypothetical protein